MKKLSPWLLLLSLFAGISSIEPASAAPLEVKKEMLGKKKKYKGYKKPKSKKILGIFKRKSDCGCPNK